MPSIRRQPARTAVRVPSRRVLSGGWVGGGVAVGVGVGVGVGVLRS